MNTEQIIAARTNTHGEYADHARVTQSIMRICWAEKNWQVLSDMQRESLHMFAHKIARICVGDPNVKDHWDDIAGYAKLVANRLPTPPPPDNPTAAPVGDGPTTLDLGGLTAGKIEAIYRIRDKFRSEETLREVEKAIQIQDDESIHAKQVEF